MDKIKTNRQIYEAALKCYGAESQTIMVMEEMAELQKELCKHARGLDNVEQIAEEIADVQIMLEQIIALYKCDGMVLRCKHKKVKRLKERILEIME